MFMEGPSPLIGLEDNKHQVFINNPHNSKGTFRGRT